MVQPGKGAFDDPASRQNHEAYLVIRTKHGLKSEAAAVSNPIEERASIATVHPDQTELLAGARQASQKKLGAIAILNRSRRDHDRHEQAQRVDQEMPFPSLDLFALVVAADAGDRSRFDALAIETTSCWMLVSTSTSSYHGSHCVMNPLPRTVVTPDPKVVVDALPLRILLGQHPPLDTADNDVQDAVDDLSHIQAARSSARFRRWNKFLDNVPLIVGQIAWVDSLVHNDDSYHELRVLARSKAVVEGSGMDGDGGRGFWHGAK